MMQREEEKQLRQREAQQKQMNDNARAAERRHPGLAKMEQSEEEIAYAQYELEGSVWTDGFLSFAI